MKTLSLMFGAMLLLCSVAFSQESETQRVVDEFFKTYKEKGHKEAVEKLLTMNRWISAGDRDNVGSKLEEVAAQIGQYYGNDKIREHRYGPNVVQYVYLVRYERQPLRFLIRFYKPNDKWQMQGFEYEVDFLDELNEAGKAFRLKENSN